MMDVREKNKIFDSIRFIAKRKVVVPLLLLLFPLKWMLFFIQIELKYSLGKFAIKMFFFFFFNTNIIGEKKK